MELKEFIKQTLIHIVTGVKEAQDGIKDNNGEVSPTGLYWEPNTAGPRLIFKPGRGIVQIVEFEVGVSTRDTESGTGGAGIFVGPLSIGAKAEGKTQNETVSQVKFTVPLLLPSEPYDWEGQRKKFEK